MGIARAYILATSTLAGTVFFNPPPVAAESAPVSPSSATIAPSVTGSSIAVRPETVAISSTPRTAAAAPETAKPTPPSVHAFRLAEIEDSPPEISFHLDEQLDRLLKLSPSSGSLVDTQAISCLYAGNEFRMRVPPGGMELQTDPAKVPAAALWTPYEVDFIFPPEPSLINALLRMARDPNDYDRPFSVRMSSAIVNISRVRGPQGGVLYSASIAPNASTEPWHNTGASIYHIQWNGKDVDIIMTGRVFGEMGRLVTALKQEKKLGRGPLIGVSRGGALWSLLPSGNENFQRRAKDLEAAGLKYSAVDSSELRHWKDLSLYISSNPAGIQFLSANLVYTSSPDATVLASSEVANVDGLRVAFVGVTPPDAAKYLGQAGLSAVTVKDPEQTLSRLLVSIRPRVDAIVVLTDLRAGSEDWTARVRGIDLVVGRKEPFNFYKGPRPVTVVEQPMRPAFVYPLLTMRLYDTSEDLLEAELSPHPDGTDWTARERHRLIDDKIETAAGWGEFDPTAFGVIPSTEPVLLPSGRRLFGSGPITARQFWTLAAGMAARHARMEVGILHVQDLTVQLDDDIREKTVRTWLNDNEPAVAIVLKGSELKSLLKDVDDQKKREQTGGTNPFPYAIGGVSADGKINGVPIDDNGDYHVVTSVVLADGLGLSTSHKPLPLGRTIDELVLNELRGHEGASVPAVRGWMEGKPVDYGGLWRVNFRDVGLNLQETQVQSGNDFANVPNSRIQGSDEFDIGGVFKADADYLRDIYRWGNTLEMQYAKSDIHPVGQPSVTNITANQISFLTTLSRRAGLIQDKWLAQSWGPSLGFDAESEFEPTNGLPRKQLYSALPGVSFFDGTWIKLLELTGNVQRDLSRDPPNTQTGLHYRLLLAHDIGPGPVSLQGEMYANYFFLTHEDTDQDLRVEGDVNFKLRVPIRKYFSIAPFIDYYYFELKTQPVWGYSAIMGITVGFSRVWKPQYERLFPDR